MYELNPCLPFLDSIPLKNMNYGNTSAPPFLLDNLLCLGQESTLLNCGHNGIGINNCELSEIAGVVCNGNGGTMYACTTSRLHCIL